MARLLSLLMLVTLLDQLICLLLHKEDSGSLLLQNDAVMLCCPLCPYRTSHMHISFLPDMKDACVSCCCAAC